MYHLAFLTSHVHRSCPSGLRSWQLWYNGFCRTTYARLVRISRQSEQPATCVILTAVDDRLIELRFLVVLVHVHIHYMPPPVRLSSVIRNARAPYSGSSNFRQYFYGIRYLGHPLTSLKISRRSSQGNPSDGGVKHKTGSQV